MNRRLLIVAIMLAGCTANVVWSATTTQINNARASGLSWLFQNQKGDGGWSTVPGLEVQTTSAVLDAYLNSGIKNGTSYNGALSKLANDNPGSVDGKARQVATMLRTGSDVSLLASQLQTARNNRLGWGWLPGYGSSPADTSLALVTLMDAMPSYSSNDIFSGLCAAILPAQGAGPSPNYGWSYLSNSSNGPANATQVGIIPSAYAILALKKASSRFSGGSCSGSSYTLSTQIANGVTFLLSKKNPDNGFGDNSTSGVLETALAYRAIEAVDPTNSNLGPALDFLIARQVGGAWANDPFETALVLQTFPVTALVDTNNDGIPDVVAALLPGGALPIVGNGHNVVGLTAPLVLTSAMLNQPFNLMLTASGGTGPYKYRILSGSLPDGLVIEVGGAVSGTPTTAGPFNFTYEAKDSLNMAVAVAGQIAVESPNDSNIPTLPEWGMILMGGLLMATMFIQDRRSRRR